MHRIKTISNCVALVLIFTLGLSVSAQESRVVQHLKSGETINLFSDRSMYIVSEELHFTAFYSKPEQIAALENMNGTFKEQTVWDGNKIVKMQVRVNDDESTSHNPGNAKSPDWSTVLYVELIGWDGTKHAQALVPIENGVASGMFQIPSNIYSGNYYLRGYTKWMRNFSPYDYANIPVKIMNPSTRMIDEGQLAEKTKALATGLIPTGIGYGIDISGIKETYKKREKVELGIDILDKDVSGKYCISVAKMDPESLPGNSTTYPSPGNGIGFDIEHLPEISGLALTGKIVNAGTGEPAAGKKVYLSSFSNSFFLSVVASEKNGSFLFTLPRNGKFHELHIAEESDSSETYEVFVNSEFCNRPVTLPYVGFQLSKQEKQLAVEMLRNAQLRSKYTVIPTDIEEEKMNQISFFGDPASVTYVKDYIELKDLREFFYELIQEVTIANDKGLPYLKISGQSGMSFYPPLVLMDNVPVANDQKLLDLSSRRIDRIEVVDQGYIIGDFKYSGIISIFSKDKDIAGLVPDTDSHFFNYQLLKENAYAPPESCSVNNGSSLPDRRNMLYWNPAIDLSSGSPVKITFFTSDAPGDYVISIRGRDDKSGTYVTEEASFTVH